MSRSVAGFITLFLLIGGLAAQSTLTLDLTGMTPHLGKLFELRIVDQSDGSEIGRTRVASIAAADFSVSVPGLAIGGSYDVDFYADHNGNGVYDAPGDDHAWRMALTNVQGDTTLAFAHNTTFTDIMWPAYVLTVDLTGMTPHLGKLFELRIVDQSDGSEIGRTRVASIAAADFSVSVPGLAIGGSYDVDFYADHNGNGVYDAPGDDHAWRMALTNVQGDTTLAFAHNTTFTDIMWPPPLAIGPEVGGVPRTFALRQNYPNPFNPATTIRYDLPRAERVIVTVYDILGHRVATLADARQAAGAYILTWNGLDQHGTRVASGLYLYRMEAGSYTEMRKMLLLK